MSELEPTAHIKTATEDEMYVQSGATYKSGFIEANDPEFEPICDKYVGILRQLEGQSKADFFHMRHFHNHDDQDALWRKMAEADNEAAAWKATIDEARSAMWGAYRVEHELIKKLSKGLIQLGLGKLALHPNTIQRGDRTIGEYTGSWQDELRTFSLVDDSFRKDETISIELPVAPEPFNYELLSNEEFRLAEHMQWHLRYEVKSKGRKLVQTGEIIHFKHDGGTRYMLIDDADSPLDSFARFNPAGFRELPLEIPAKDDEFTPDSQTISAFIEMVRSAEPIIKS